MMLRSMAAGLFAVCAFSPAKWCLRALKHYCPHPLMCTAGAVHLQQPLERACTAVNSFVLAVLHKRP